MKKLLSIIILTLSLSGCKTNVDYPTSMFGVELPNDVTNYMSKSEWEKVKNKNKDLKFFATTAGKYQKNNLFDDYYMYVNTNTNKISIVLGIATDYVLTRKFSNKCEARRLKLLTSLKELKNIKERNYDKEYYIKKQVDDKNQRNDYYLENHFLNYNINDYQYSLNIECKYSYPNNYTSVQRLSYSLTVVNPENFVTDEKIIKELNEKVDEERRVLKKPLSDEMIKNDFRGL